jgi:putative membrane protein
MPRQSARQDLESDRPNIDLIILESDRTLLVVINTSITLIGFGFTINEIFGNAAGRSTLLNVDVVGRILGLSLLSLGLILLTLGINVHVALIRHLTGQRPRIFLIIRPHASRQYRYSAVFLVAVLLLAIGVFALGAVIVGMIYGGLAHGFT